MDRHRYPTIAVRVAAIVVAALSLMAASATAVVVRKPNGQLAGLTPRSGVSPSSIQGAAGTGDMAAMAPLSGFSANGNLNYHSGPVLHSTAPYLIFWDPSSGIPGSTSTLLERYFTDVAADTGTSTDVFAVNRQFTDSTGYADNAQTFATGSQAILDTQAYPARDTTNCTRVTAGHPTCVTDAQLQAEITRLISADGLPTGTGADAPIYFVVFPANVNSCFSSTQCADNTFCAYHSSFTDSSAQVLYADIPMLLAVSNPKSCQFDNNSAVQEPNGDVGDVVIKYLSHEDSETITDPLGNAWWDSNTGNEDGDNCNFWGSTVDPQNGSNPNAFGPTLGGSAVAGTLYDELINGNQYYTQTEWSNGDVNCEAQPSSQTLAPSFTTTAPALPNTAVTFDPSASSTTNSYTSVTWDFGDGHTTFSKGSPVSVQHSYTTTGQYTTKLTLVDASGNLSATTRSVLIGSRPTAAFTPSTTQTQPNTPLSFDASASSDSNAGGSVASYAWDFGDGSNGTGVNPSHQYTTPGMYTVSLTVTDNFGLQSTATTAQITVGTAPTASFTAPAVDAIAAPVMFDATASTDPNAGGSIASYAWDFGDGHQGTGSAPSHAYVGPGTYAVSLTVTDNYGLHSVATTKQVHIYVPPGAAVDQTAPVAVNRPIGFDGRGSSDGNAGGSITTYDWNFGDGSSLSGANAQPSHAYAAVGDYTVTLTVTDNFGLVSQPVTTQVQVRLLPNAAFSDTPGTAGINTSILFDGSSSADPNAGGTIASYSWNFGDGTTTSGTTPTAHHAYAHAGHFTASLTVTNGYGFTSTTVSHTLTVVPGVAFTVLTPHPGSGEAISFDGSASSDPGGAITSYAWNFGDGGSASGAKPRHVFRRPGSYMVTLTVTDSSGVQASTSRTITIPLSGRITKVSQHRSQLSLTLNGPGVLIVGSRHFVITHAKTLKLKPPLTPAQKRRLATHHQLRLILRIKFVPRNGLPQTRVVHVLLHG